VVRSASVPAHHNAICNFSIEERAALSVGPNATAVVGEIETRGGGYGIDGILRIGFWLLASSRQAPTDLAHLLLAAQISIWLLTNFFKKTLVAATVYKTNG
jgi:hypothetical protein